MAVSTPSIITPRPSFDQSGSRVPQSASSLRASSASSRWSQPCYTPFSLLTNSVVDRFYSSVASVRVLPCFTLRATPRFLAPSTPHHQWMPVHDVRSRWSTFTLSSTASRGTVFPGYLLRKYCLRECGRWVLRSVSAGNG